MKIEDTDTTLLKHSLLQTTLFCWERHIVTKTVSECSCCYLYTSRLMYPESFLSLFRTILSGMMGQEISFVVHNVYNQRSWFYYFENHDLIRQVLVERGWLPSTDVDLNNVENIHAAISTVYTDYLRKIFNKVQVKATPDIHGPPLWFLVHALSKNPFTTRNDYCNLISSLYIYQLCGVCLRHMNDNYYLILNFIRQVENSTTSHDVFCASVTFHKAISKFLNKPIISDTVINQIEKNIDTLWR